MLDSSDDEIEMNLGLLERAQNKVKEHKLKRQRQLTQSLQLINTGPIEEDDIFYKEIDRAFKESSLNVDRKEVPVNKTALDELRTILFKLGLQEDEVESQLNQFLEEKEKAKKEQKKITKIDFSSKNQNYIKILRQETQKIYKKNLVEQIEQTRKKNSQLNEIRKNMKLDSLEAQNKTPYLLNIQHLDVDEDDVRNSRVKMSPQVRGSLVKRTPSPYRLPSPNRLSSPNKSTSQYRQQSLNRLPSPLKLTKESEERKFKFKASKPYLPILNNVQKKAINSLKEKLKTEPFNTMELKKTLFQQVIILIQPFLSNPNPLKYLERDSIQDLNSIIFEKQKISQSESKVKFTINVSKVTETSPRKHRVQRDLQMQRYRLQNLTEQIDTLFDKTKIEKENYEKYFKQMRRHNNSVLESINPKEMQSLKFLSKNEENAFSHKILRKIKTNSTVLNIL